MKKKKIWQKIEDFDKAFDDGKVEIDFSDGIKTEGLSKLIKFPPLNLPQWISKEVERIAKHQANSKSSVIRQLLVEAIEARRKIAS